MESNGQLKLVISFLDGHSKVIFVSDDLRGNELCEVVKEKMDFPNEIGFCLLKLSDDGFAETILGYTAQDELSEKQPTLKELEIEPDTTATLLLDQFPGQSSEDKGLKSILYAQAREAVRHPLCALLESEALVLGALQLREAFGPYDPAKHSYGYFSADRTSEFLSPSITWYPRIKAKREYWEHRLFSYFEHGRCGGEAADCSAQKKYIELAEKQRTFGLINFRAKIDKAEVTIGIGPCGFSLLPHIAPRPAAAAGAARPEEEFPPPLEEPESLPTDIEFRNVTAVGAADVSDMAETGPRREGAAAVRIQYVRTGNAAAEASAAAAVPSEGAGLQKGQLLLALDPPAAAAGFAAVANWRRGLHHEKKEVKEVATPDVPEVLKQMYLQRARASNSPAEAVDLHLVSVLDTAIDTGEGLVRVHVAPGERVSPAAYAALAGATEDYLRLPIREAGAGVKGLELAATGITPVSAGSVRTIIAGWPSLAQVSLARNHISNAGSLKLVPSFSLCPDLAALDVSSCNIGNKGITAVCNDLAALGNLTHINFENNRITDRGFQSGILALMRTCKSLANVKVGKNPVTSASMRALASVVPHMPRLVDLSLAGICDNDGLVSICSVLCNCQKIRRLDLGENYLASDSAASLGNVLRDKDCQLESLDLRKNHIGAVGALLIADGLVKNKRVKTIILADNGITQDGAEEFAVTLRKNTVVEFVDLSSNTFPNAERVYASLRKIASVKYAYV